MSIQDLVEAAVIRALERHDSKILPELKHIKEQVEMLKSAVDTMLKTKELDDDDAQRGSPSLSAVAR